MMLTLNTPVKRWGNSYAVRLTSQDLRRLGVREGQMIHVAIETTANEPIDLSTIPTFHCGGFEAAREDYYNRRPREGDT